ncbi:MAG: hypothetical protein M4579_001858 [Chaenotheca gracillima]|nr:MAG: hypothetical protein M4579_001858 [Chaenotheca gracillima]
MADEELSHYDDSNRAFLQAFLARGTLTYDEAKPILAAIFTAHEDRETLPEDVTEADFNSYIHAAHDAISPFDLAIRSTLSQHDRSKRIWALINTTSDPITQLATTRTPDEISFVKRLLDAMFITHNTTRHEVMALTSMQAVRLHKAIAGAAGGAQPQTQGSTSQSLTMSGAEKVLRDLVDEGWFEKSRAGFYSLSPRALLELNHYLVSTYNEDDDEEEEDDEEENDRNRRRLDRVKTCNACREIITVGQRCPKLTCPCRLHTICTQGFFTAQRSQKCPLCSTEWTGKDYVGEMAVTTTDAWRKGRRRSSHANGGRDEAEDGDD